MRKRLALLNLLILSAMTAEALPSYTFTRYLERNGIPTTRVEKIIQDADGYLWLASWSGLYRFDGLRFISFRKNPAAAAASAADERLADLSGDRFGQLWLLTMNNVLHRFDCSSGESGKPLAYGIQAIFKLAGDDFRFVTSHGTVLKSDYSRDGKDCTLSECLRLPRGENVISVFSDSDGTVWTLTDKGIYSGEKLVAAIPGLCSYESTDKLYIGSTGGRMLIAGKNRTSIENIGTDIRVELIAAVPGREEFLAGSGESGLFCWNRADGSVTRVKNDSWNGGPLRQQRDRFGNLWIYSENGSLNWYDKDARKLVPFYNSRLQPAWNPETRLNALFVDSQGNLWLSGSWGGLERASYNAGEFRLRPIDSRPGASPAANDVRAVFQSGDGTIYVSTRDCKVHLLDSLLHEIAFWQTEAPVYTITQAGDGNIWLGTKGSGIIENTAGPSEAADYRPHHYAKSEDYYAPNSELIYDFNSDSPDRLWIASFDGSLSYVDMSDSERRFISKKNLLSFPTEQLNMMRHVSFGPDGKLYASGTLGLFVCPNPDADAQDLRFIRFPRVKDYDIQHILFTGGGELWASSSGNGFIRLESTSPDSNIRTFTTRSGLMSNFVLSAIEDRSGNIWIASNGGLNKFNPRTGSIIGYSYGRIGLNMRFNEGKPLMASDGKIYFNTTRGLMYFDPDEVSNSSFVPKILVNSLTVTGKRKNPDASGTVRMRKRDALNLNFSAIDLSAPERVIYYYMLDGRDRQWNSLGNDPRIHIDRLKPGKYSLRLRSTNGDGVFTDNEKTIELVVSPDFLPCLLLAVLFLGAAAFSLTRRRTLPSPGTEDDLDSAQRFKKEFSEYLAEHIDDGELNITEMAAAMNMSRSALFGKCRSATGMAPLEYLRSMRFSKAAEMLGSDRYSISQIAWATGFNDSHYFSKAFKQKFGMTPSEYRRRHR